MIRARNSALILGAVFTLLSRRFRDDSGAQLSGFWRGAWASGVLFCLALIFDAIIVFRQNDGMNYWPDSYLENGGLLTSSPSWITIGIAFTTILCTFHRAIQWQKQQTGQNVAFKTRLKTLFDAPDDGLMRFDFGWVFGMIARCTAWILLLGGMTALCFNLQTVTEYLGLEPSQLGTMFMVAALLLSLLLHFDVWRHLTRRRLTLRLGLRLISQSLLGFFVASSLIYALVTFVSLPFAFRFERNFQNAMQRGEVKIARAKLGL